MWNSNLDDDENQHIITIVVTLDEQREDNDDDKDSTISISTLYEADESIFNLDDINLYEVNTLHTKEEGRDT